jgi:hypothetical protein
MRGLDATLNAAYQHFYPQDDSCRVPSDLKPRLTTAAADLRDKSELKASKNV